MVNVDVSEEERSEGTFVGLAEDKSDGLADGLVVGSFEGESLR